MKRFYDWQLRFEAFVRERAQRPFCWGENDCGLFAAACVEAITGERVGEALRGYHSARQALRLQRRPGGLRALACEALGEPISARLANTGDIVLIPAGKREALAVCNGGCAIVPGPEAMTAVSMQHALLGWRVG